MNAATVLTASSDYDTLYDLFVDVREETQDVWARRAETYSELDNA